MVMIAYERIIYGIENYVDQNDATWCGLMNDDGQELNEVM
jgi:hypothetical protein